MARTLKRFKPRGKYPWGRWTDGRIWEITQGTDFQVSIKAMVSALYDRARRKGFDHRITQEGDRISFQYKPKKARASK